MPERCVALRPETKRTLDMFHELARERSISRDIDIFCKPELAKAAKEAIKELAEDLIRHTGVDRRTIKAVSFKIHHRRPGSLAAPTGNASMSEIVKFCEGCTCHYGYYSAETQTCEYIGSGVEEGCVE